MKRLLLGLLLLMSTFALADENVRILDVGLHGYMGPTTPVIVSVRNASPQAETLSLKAVLTPDLTYEPVAVATLEVSMQGGERRTVELPMLTATGNATVRVQASVGATLVGEDKYKVAVRSNKVVALLCENAAACKEVQSQAQFSGTVEERADKNRQLPFEVVDDFREHGWAYSAASAVVVARPLSQLTEWQKQGLEEYVRGGGALVILEKEIADGSFLAPYRSGESPQQGRSVGEGHLFRVASLGANTLGEVFAGQSLKNLLTSQLPGMRWSGYQQNWLVERYAARFDFPKLRWVLLWLAAYILVIGLLNFAVLRRFRRLEYGWLTACVVALLFAAGFYLSGTSHRPKQFRIDNLAMYYMDDQSSWAAADYELRVSAPSRRDVRVTVGDNAVFVHRSLARDSETNSRIWDEVNEEKRAATQAYDVHVGASSWVELSLLKWSYHDLQMQGMRRFEGTVHFVTPKRLRNDTGQRFEEAMYLDYDADKLYEISNLGPGAEVQVDGLPSMPARLAANEQMNYYVSRDARKDTLKMAVRGYQVSLVGAKHMFVGLTDGPSLQAELDVPAEQRAKAVVVVGMEPQK